ncbi:MAG: porin [Rhodanobacter sp.]|uniref:porin n=1 Tax=Rhodanobacter sp. KK11 TaxID=3083255 RepID=UPI0029662A6B|nr:porin [Rhodanobacter sp. KK11]MDW2981242.1 porin [Rhodanobacter sp. KK11]
MTTRHTHRYTALALSMACALMLPLAGHAQNDTREQQLEQRVAQLEQQLNELKAMIQAQKAAPAQPPTPATPAQNVAAAPAAPVFSSAPGVSVALHGFVSASAFSQDRSFTFGNGTNAEFPVPGSKGSLSGMDVRNTRFWLDFSGAKFAGDWVGGGRIEMDFFGGFNGTGPYSQQQLTPRLRQAYMDIANPATGTTVRIGQQWELMFPIDNIPDSLSHIAFPLGFGAGMVGWRFPGVVVMQDLNHGSDGAKWRLDLGAFEGHWSGPGDNVNYLTAGNAGFRPQLEARLRVADKTWVAYAAAHYSEVDLKGVGNTVPAPIKDKVKSVGYEVGGAWMPGPWVFKGLAYGGKGLGQIFGALAQFGDISESGGYVQAGYKFTPNWSAYAYYGIAKPDHDDVLRWIGTAGRLESRQSALSVQYATGAYALSVEWLHDKLDSANGATATRTTTGNQVSLNGMYKF